MLQTDTHNLHASNLLGTGLKTREVKLNKINIMRYKLDKNDFIEMPTNLAKHCKISIHTDERF